ncbi:MAG: M55 family metallopeptidase [Patescibacteria group bacterium]
MNKRLLIVVDMEGIAGIPMSHIWSTVPGFPTYYPKRRLLVREVNAAIAGALNAGIHPEEIVVLDWHWVHLNFFEKDLPSGVTLIRDGEGDLLRSGSIEKIFLLGFHGGAGTFARYAHTMRYAIKTMRVAGKTIGETGLWSYVAGSMHVPVALITGDSLAIEEMKQYGGETVCIETKNQKETPSPDLIYEKIEKAAEEAVDKTIAPIPTSSPFAIEFIFKSRKLTKDIPQKYFTRRNNEYLVIENKTALEVYENFRGKIYAYLKKVNPLYLVRNYFT